MYRFFNQFNAHTQNHGLDVGSTVMAACAANLTGSGDVSIVQVIGEKDDGWSTTNTRATLCIANTGPGHLGCQFTITESAGTFTATCRMRINGANRTINLTDSGVSWGDFGNQTVFLAVREGSNFTFSIVDDVLGTYSDTLVQAGDHEIDACNIMQLARSAGITGNSDRQNPQGVFGSAFIVDGAVSLADIEDAVAADDLSAIIQGPANAWGDDIVAGIGISNPVGNSVTPEFLPGEEVPDGGSSPARVSVYGKGVSGYDDPGTTVVETTNVLNIVKATTDYTISCVDPASQGWVATGSSVTATDDGDREGPSSTINALAAGSISGQKRIGVWGNSRVASQTSDASDSVTRNTTGLTTDDTAAAVGHHVDGLIVRSYIGGAYLAFEDVIVGAGRAGPPLATIAYPFMALTGTARTSNNAAYVSASTSSAFDIDVGKAGFNSHEDGGPSLGSFWRLNPSDWASGGDSKAQFLMSCNGAMLPSDSRRVTLLFLRAPQMSTEVIVRRMGAASGATTNPAATVLSTAAATVNLNRPNVLDSTVIDAVSGNQTFTSDGIQPTGVIQVGRCVTFRKSGEPGTAFSVISSVASDTGLDPQFVTEQAVGGTGGITTSEAMMVGQWSIEAVDVEIDASLFGTDSGQIPNSMVGVEIENTDTDYPAYLLGVVLECADRDGPVFIPFGKGGVPYDDANDFRFLTPNADTGTTALQACASGLGIDAFIFTGADQGASSGSGATAVADALGVILDELSSFERVVSCCPPMGTWATLTDRLDYANKARVEAADRNLAFIDAWSSMLGDPRTQYALCYRQQDSDGAHLSALGSKAYMEAFSTAALSVVFASSDASPTPIIAAFATNHLLT